MLSVSMLQLDKESTVNSVVETLKKQSGSSVHEVLHCAGPYVPAGGAGPRPLERGLRPGRQPAAGAAGVVLPPVPG